MRTLVLGGTAWLGRHVAQAALDRGHEVTCLARGRSGEAPAAVRFVVGDRDHPAGLEGVAGQDWDLLVDLARQPVHAARAAHALAARARHAVFVSSGSVYADHSVVGAGPDAPLLAVDLEDDPATAYGSRKVACEIAYADAFGPDRLLVARSGLIGGPEDHTSRSGYWPWRFAHPSGTQVLVPDEPDQGVQLVDVRDLAGWLVDAGERRLTGVVDAVGTRTTLSEVLEACRALGSPELDLATASSRWLVDHGVESWMGPHSLPWWLGGDPDWQGFAARSDASARAAGLVPRPLAETLAAALAWEEARVGNEGWPETSGAGLTDDAERALLARSPSAG